MFFMAKGKVSEDVVKLIVEAETSKLQQAIHESKKSIKGLEDDRKHLLEQQKTYHPGLAPVIGRYLYEKTPISSSQTSVFSIPLSSSSHNHITSSLPYTLSLHA